MSDAISKLLPKSEELVTTYNLKDHTTVYVMSYDRFKGVYILYSYANGKIKKIGRGENPLNLEEKYSVAENIGCT